MALLGGQAKPARRLARIGLDAFALGIEEADEVLAARIASFRRRAASAHGAGIIAAAECLRRFAHAGNRRRERQGKGEHQEKCIET